jgi:enoyl-CoA hydratase/carnithine racemase
VRSQWRSDQPLGTTGVYETITFNVGDDHVAEVILARPEVLNSFNQRMLDEFQMLWREVAANDDIHVVLIAASGDRAFSTGVDRRELYDVPDNIWNWRDPGEFISAKQNGVWKPVVCAVNGMVAGGAFYWINDADIVIAADDALFFDPHVNYGMTSVFEPSGMAQRVNVGEALRMALMALDERITPKRALEIGLISEVVPRANLLQRAHEIAARVAAKPSDALQASVRAIWESRQMPPMVANAVAVHYEQLARADRARRQSGDDQ